MKTHRCKRTGYHKERDYEKIPLTPFSKGGTYMEPPQKQRVI